jgi:carboxymethylenebutenolidase
MHDQEEAAMGDDIQIETPTGAMNAFVARPESGSPAPVAVLYMDAIGYRDGLKGIAERYAQAGYYTVVADLFHHFGEGIVFDIHKVIAEQMKGPESERLLGTIAKLTPEMVEQDTRAILDHVALDEDASDGPKVCLGFCMGARHALRTMTAFSDDFVAGCGIHPGVLVTGAPDSPHRDLEGIQGELYLGFAERDGASTPEILSALEEEARRQDVAVEIEVYADTDHGFVMTDLPMFKAEARERHFARTLEVWERNLRIPA